jgi:glycosyltransferase involved in cell wall biosynthesis
MSEFAPITVVIPCYRSDQTIARAISSVVNQSMPPSEILLIEDCSDDEGKTRHALLEIQNLYPQCNIRITFLPQNGGPSEARNVGWQNASQPYIAFLDADDSWHPEKLKIQYSWMKAHPEVLITAHESSQFCEKKLWPINENPQIIKLKRKRFYIHNPVSLRSIMLRRSMPYRFNPSFRAGAEDYLLWFEMILDGVEIFYIKLILSFSYKNDYGEAGLNGNLWASYCDVLNVYRNLCEKRSINFIAYLCSSFFATLLFAKRIVVVFARKIREML